MTQTRVQPLSRSKAGVYLNRAQNLLRAMELAEKEANPDGVATSAVQAAIALGDAYTIHFRQERCRGQDHHEVLALVARCNTPNKGEVSSALSRILARKSEVEYQDRAVTLKDAQELAKWVRGLDSLVRGDLQG
ncbi:MAG: hypothetical protein WAN87_09170 [Thermoplasmata archaeon]